jgi:hypothetical protein
MKEGTIEVKPKNITIESILNQIIKLIKKNKK